MPNNSTTTGRKAEYSNWTVNDIRQELRKRGLPQNGAKIALIERLDKSDLESTNNRHSKRQMSQDATSNGPKTLGHMSSEENHVGVEFNQIRSEEETPSMEDLKKLKQLERERRAQIVLWKKPIVTLKYFVLESLIIFEKERRNVLKHKKTCSTILLITILVTLAYLLEGSHQEFVVSIKKQLFWCAYWVGLGILSSVGLGTGLHTFLLYLGPHIAQVTLAAWECETLDFQEPPYPEQILCPRDNHKSTVSMWTIMNKVRLEAFMWGAGTAIGELPPYFMAKAARLSGTEVDDEDIEKFEEIIGSESKDFFTRAQRFIPQLVERVGFFGILACASIPNPLFDLAGITCGHCLVPFWTFFGATLIGKAIIKMHIQQTFVVLCFSKTYVELVLMLIGKIPVVGSYIQAPFLKAVQVQKEKLHSDPTKSQVNPGGNILGFIFEKVVTVMIIYFVISIANSMAQSYAKRVDEESRQTQPLKQDKKE